MSTIVGPIPKPDWKFMASLLGNINNYKKKNDPRFAYALERYQAIYKALRDKYHEKVA